MFGFNECYILISWIVLCYWQWTSYSSTQDKTWYESKRDQKWMPPAWIFPIAWTLLYAALVVMMYMFTQNTPADSWQIALGFALFVIHIAANKEWSVAFWDRNSPSQAFAILMAIMLPTSLALYFPFIINNQTDLYYVPVIMLSIYNAWLLYASTLNYYWMTHKK
jgi:tryptophan-rich sensory protein